MPTVLHKGKDLEPTSTGTSAAGLAVWKAMGGIAGMGAIGAGLATLVVMCILRPRTQSEWIVGVISTVVASISGGAAAGGDDGAVAAAGVGTDQKSFSPSTSAIE